MSTIYARSEDSSTCLNKTVLAFLATGTIFSLLPVLQIIPDLWTPDSPSIAIADYNEDPPIVIEPAPEEPKEKPKIEKPEIEKSLPKLTLTQLENRFNFGSGPGGYNVGFNPNDLVSLVEALEIFELDELEKKPRALFQVEPVFPYALKNQRIEGWVLLEWVITDRGRVTSIRAIQYSHQEFIQPSINSISKSKWEPGEISNKPVNTRVRQKITYNL